MSSAENGRLVWISGGTREFIMPSLERQLRKVGKSALANDVKHWMRAYDAAPADPGKALEDASDAYFLSASTLGSANLADATRFLLEALGVPQRPTPRDEAPS